MPCGLIKCHIVKKGISSTIVAIVSTLWESVLQIAKSIRKKRFSHQYWMIEVNLLFVHHKKVVRALPDRSPNCYSPSNQEFSPFLTNQIFHFMFHYTLGYGYTSFLIQKE